MLIVSVIGEGSWLLVVMFWGPQSYCSGFGALTPHCLNAAVYGVLKLFFVAAAGAAGAAVLSLPDFLLMLLVNSQAQIRGLL